MNRHQLSDAQWECIEDLFPAFKRTDRPPMNYRKAFDAIIWILRTGSAWRDIPLEFGNWRTIYGLFDKWNADGTLGAIVDRLRSSYFDADTIDMSLWCVDGTIVRAHRIAAGGGKLGNSRSQLITL